MRALLYKSYCRFYRFDRWRQCHVTRAGFGVVLILSFLCLTGFQVSRTNFYQAAAFYLSVLLVSVFYSLFPLKIHIKINRCPPRYLTAGKPSVYEIEIRNLGRKTQKGLFLYEALHDGCPSFERFLKTREPFESERNIWDRKTCYYRFRWLVDRQEKARFEPVALPVLPPGETVRVKIRVSPIFRGFLSLSGTIITRPDALGLFNRVKRINNSEKFLVVPDRYPVSGLQLSLSRHFHPGGILQASSVGDSDEFMSLRGYRPGDPMRNIHWRSFAKTREIVIKEFEDEHFVRYLLLLDTFAPPEREAEFEEAVRIAASYVSLMDGPESILDLILAGVDIHSYASGRGLGNNLQMLQALSCVEKCSGTTNERIVFTLRALIPKISGAVCIFTEWNKLHSQIFRLFLHMRIHAKFVVVTKDTMQTTQKISNEIQDLTQIMVVEPGRAGEVLGAR